MKLRLMKIRTKCFFNCFYWFQDIFEVTSLFLLHAYCVVSTTYRHHQRMYEHSVTGHPGSQEVFTLSETIYRRHLSLRETWPSPGSIWSCCVTKVFKICIGKNGNRHYSWNFDIFAIKMTFFNALLSFLLSNRSEAFSASFPLVRKSKGYILESGLNPARKERKAAESRPNFLSLFCWGNDF